LVEESLVGERGRNGVYVEVEEQRERDLEVEGYEKERRGLWKLLDLGLGVTAGVGEFSVEMLG
jgi:hypothetical protein